MDQREVACIGALPYGNAPVDPQGSSRFVTACWASRRSGDMEIDGYRGGNLTGRVIQCIIHVHQTLGPGFGRHRLDLLVEGQVILELKTVEALSKAHYAQVRSYLRATRMDVALLINFADDRADFRRVEGS
jgi:hypothetical protein